jgi:hypothetical protein
MSKKAVIVVATLMMAVSSACGGRGQSKSAAGGENSTLGVGANKFYQVHSAGQAMIRAIGLGVTLAGFRELLEMFDHEVAVAQDTAINGQEKRVAAMYGDALADYTDALTLWNLLNHLISPVMRMNPNAVENIQRSLFGHDDALFLPDDGRTPQVMAIIARYNIPTVTTSNGKAISVTASLSVVWEAARQKFDAANRAAE